MDKNNLQMRVKLFSNFLTDHSLRPFQGGFSFVDQFCYYLCFVFVCLTVLSVPCSLVGTCWERAELLAL